MEGGDLERNDHGKKWPDTYADENSRMGVLMSKLKHLFTKSNSE